MSDGGVYKFVAKDAVSEANVKVNEEPIQIKKRLQDQDGLENTEVVFECELNKPNLPVEWCFNELPIDKVFAPDSYVITQVDNKYILTIPKCQLKQQGTFSMNIPNSNLKTRANLSIDGKNFLTKMMEIIKYKI